MDDTTRPTTARPRRTSGNTRGPLTGEMVDRWFAPRDVLTGTPADQARRNTITEAFKRCAIKLLYNTRGGADQANAMRQLRLAHLAALDAIDREEDREPTVPQACMCNAAPNRP